MFPCGFAGKRSSGTVQKEVISKRRDPDKPLPFCITLKNEIEKREIVSFL